MSEKDKKSHWYLACLNVTVLHKTDLTKFQVGWTFSSGTQNINKVKLNAVEIEIKKDMVKNASDETNVLDVNILSLSYLGFMTEEEFYQ